MNWVSEDRPSRSCGCIGPQNGEPLCPCLMRGVRVIDGRYVRIQDLGPVKLKLLGPSIPEPADVNLLSHVGNTCEAGVSHNARLAPYSGDMA